MLVSFTLPRRLSSRLVVVLLAGTIGLGVAPERAALDGDAIFLPSRITTDFDGADDRVAAIAVQPDGRLLAAGYARVDGVSRIALARYLPGGVLDPTFSRDGKALSLIGAWSAANAVPSKVTARSSSPERPPTPPTAPGSSPSPASWPTGGPTRPSGRPVRS